MATGKKIGRGKRKAARKGSALSSFVRGKISAKEYFSSIGAKNVNILA